jgi:hypothetical protein
MVEFNFNAGDYRPNTGGVGTVPTGEYNVCITSTEVKNNKAGTGQMLVVTMSVQDGEQRGRKVVDRLNLSHPNAQTVEIAFSTLSAICHVTGRMQFTDTAQLHGIPFRLSVLEKPRDDDPTKTSNDIMAYMDAQGNAPGAAGSAPASGGPAPQSAPVAAPVAAPAPVAAAAPVTAPVAAAPAPAYAPAPVLAPAAAPAPVAPAPAAPVQHTAASGKPPWEQ